MGKWGWVITPINGVITLVGSPPCIYCKKTCFGGSWSSCRGFTSSWEGRLKCLFGAWTQWVRMMGNYTQHINITPAKYVHVEIHYTHTHTYIYIFMKWHSDTPKKAPNIAPGAFAIDFREIYYSICITNLEIADLLVQTPTTSTQPFLQLQAPQCGWLHVELERLIITADVPWSKVAILGMVIQPLIGNPYDGYINPYGLGLMSLSPIIWKYGSLDPSTC